MAFQSTDSVVSRSALDAFMGGVQAVPSGSKSSSGEGKAGESIGDSKAGDVDVDKPRAVRGGGKHEGPGGARDAAAAAAGPGTTTTMATVTPGDDGKTSETKGASSGDGKPHEGETRKPGDAGSGSAMPDTTVPIADVVSAVMGLFTPAELMVCVPRPTGFSCTSRPSVYLFVCVCARMQEMMSLDNDVSVLT